MKAISFKLLKKNQVQVEVNPGGARNNVADAFADVVLYSVKKIGINHEIWIDDSIASCHYCNNDDKLYDETAVFEKITVGNGNMMTLS
jgi:hypothetical protein